MMDGSTLVVTGTLAILPPARPPTFSSFFACFAAAPASACASLTPARMTRPMASASAPMSSRRTDGFGSAVLLPVPMPERGPPVSVMGLPFASRPRRTFGESMSSELDEPASTSRAATPAGRADGRRELLLLDDDALRLDAEWGNDASWAGGD